MSKKQDLFIPGMAYTIDRIAKKLSRSSNYVDGRMTKVTPCAEISTEAGPSARGWSGKVLNPDDEDSMALHNTAEYINSDQRVYNHLVPIRDGLMVCYKNE